jgi:hypothetical protein
VQRIRAALSDVMQLTLDFESYNDFNKFGTTLDKMDFDFNKDLKESSQPADWPDENPENDCEDEVG